MKQIIALLFIGIAVFYLYEFKGAPSHHDREMVYAKALVKYKIASREIELIAVAHNYKDAQCDENLVKEALQHCVADQYCSQATFTCQETIESRYQDLLEEQPARTRYVHLTGKNDDRKGAIIVWGLTDSEARVVCDRIRAGVARDKKLDVTTKCI
ncbi:hypothetical protein AAEU32_03280 [Pseudoalteromonas sp. SSDWG2]|uniref:hypothetical protein n=1 Tax=Pseudoalteromonas sp. SSDWG2 TaxID=3139391 RepID=UPI003BAD01E5